MRFEKIDDKTMKCFISKEELEEYDISYKDFIMRSDKAREVMEDIMAQAEEEVGFKPPQFALELQIMVLPDHGMVLTFLEKTPEDLKNSKGAMEYLGMIKDALGLKDGDIAKALGFLEERSNLPKKESDEPAPEKAKEAGQSETPAVTFAVFAFRSISDICEYAQILPGNLRVKSELYEADGVYYLFLDKGTASYERYSRACIRALEYGSLYAADESKVEYIKEHGQCLISDHAVKKLRF